MFVIQTIAVLALVILGVVLVAVGVDGDTDMTVAIGGVFIISSVVLAGLIDRGIL